MIDRSHLPSLRDWLPALSAAFLAWLVFLIVGQTPLIRASGMALAVMGMALALRSMGPALSVIGGLALALSPSFWIQTGGAESLNALEVVAALAAVTLVGVIAVRFSHKPLIGIGIIVVVFVALFLSVIGTPRSLRLTTLLTAWSLFLLIDGLLVSNPRADAPLPGTFGPQHSYGLLLLLVLGVLNDPLFTLLIPAAALGFFLAKQRLAPVFWIALLALVIFGVTGIINTYYSDYFWNLTTDRIVYSGARHIPFLVADGWREPLRWIGLSELIIQQFTWAGLALGILGLARFARWYPFVGVVTMIAFGSYALFGLSYFGEDRPVLMLPLLMVQIVWMTYAVYTFGQWLTKSRFTNQPRANWFAAAAFTLLPLFMLLRIVGAI
ncbi:MAG: hypothetical protein IPO91_28075 [Chloroflexi bacterium]|nr:hypothetical protein [Chloroflexota bacterium]